MLEHNRGKAEFFTDRVDGELWVGRHRGVDESQAYYGVDECRPTDALSEYLRRAARRASIRCGFVRGHDDDDRSRVFDATDADARARGASLRDAA